MHRRQGAQVTDDLSADTAVLRASGDRLLAHAGTVGNVDDGSLAARRGAYGHAALAASSAAFAALWTRGMQAAEVDVSRRGRYLSFEGADTHAAAAANAVDVAP